MSQYVQNGQRVDFMSIDVEGGELDALTTNDWDRFRPIYLMVEVAFSGEKISDFLAHVDYLDVWCNGCNALFMDCRAVSSPK